jgi:hypothetical protein
MLLCFCSFVLLFFHFLLFCSLQLVSMGLFKVVYPESFTLISIARRVIARVAQWPYFVVVHPGTCPLGELMEVWFRSWGQLMVYPESVSPLEHSRAICFSLVVYPGISLLGAHNGTCSTQLSTYLLRGPLGGRVTCVYDHAKEDPVEV